MKVRVFTGRVQDGWTDLIDTTVKLAEREPQAVGAILAPAKYLVFGHKAWRGDKRFSNWQAISTAEYQTQYRAILLKRFYANPEQFRKLLVGDETDEIRSLTLGCYCPCDATNCHRFYLAQHVLKGCAAYFGIDYEYVGERVKTQ
jgi:hypothetical protein